MNNNVSGNKVPESNLLGVLMALKSNIMRDLSVADVAVIESIKDSKIYCRILGDTTKTISCIKLQNLDIKVGDCVIILYTNTDFRLNLNRYINNQTIQSQNNKEFHNKNFGIIIGLIYRR